MRVHQDIEPQEQIEGPSDNMNGPLPARDDGSRQVDLHGVAIGQIKDDDIYCSLPRPADKSTKRGLLPLIAPPLLLSGKPHQRSDRLAFVLMALDQGLATCANSSPFTNETGTTEQVALNAQSVVTPHVKGQVDTTHIQRSREDFELAT